jgi:hypothetical protein
MDAEVQMDSLGRMTCDARSYDVSLNALIIAGDPEHPSTLQALAAKQANSVRFLPARLPGVRLVTQCVMEGATLDDAHGCWWPLAFWASDDQFDPSLGVHIAAMQSTQHDEINANELIQVMAEGSGPSVPSLVAPRVSVLVRTADGEVLYRQPSLPLDTPIVSGLVDLAAPERPGKKVRILTWARRFDRSAPSAKAVIVDMEFKQP